MNKKSLKECKKAGCHTLTRDSSGYCKEHIYLKDKDKTKKNRYYDKNIRQVRDKKFTNFYNSSEWMRMRDYIKTRDNGLCQECLRRGDISFIDAVHHIVELKDNWDLRLDPDNLEGICNVCHNKMH